MQIRAKKGDGRKRNISFWLDFLQAEITFLEIDGVYNIGFAIRLLFFKKL